MMTSPAAVAEGVREINQACVAAPCFPGALDTPGFPVTLGEEGAYRLTSDLVVSGPVPAIEISPFTEAVELDLNGFAIRGSNVGTIGIDGVSSTARVRVWNGTIRDFAGDGIRINGTGSRLERLQILSNGGVGAFMGSGATLSNLGVYGNGGHGLEIRDGVVVDSVIADNGGDGLHGEGTFSRNVLFGNADDGIESTDCLIEHNSIRSNDDDGIHISTLGKCIVLENAIYLNGDFGIRESFGSGTPAESGYARNAINGNTSGTISSNHPPRQLDGNVCNGNLTCP